MDIRIAPCRCWGCGLVSEPRAFGQTPNGWLRGNSRPGDYDHGHYWCPDCCEALERANADLREGRVRRLSDVVADLEDEPCLE